MQVIGLRFGFVLSKIQYPPFALYSRDFPIVATSPSIRSIINDSRKKKNNYIYIYSIYIKNTVKLITKWAIINNNHLSYWDLNDQYFRSASHPTITETSLYTRIHFSSWLFFSLFFLFPFFFLLFYFYFFTFFNIE